MNKRPFQYGSITLPSNIFCAPLAGCSDLPFRRMLAKYRPGLMFCEMVKMDALIRNLPDTLRLLEYEPSMHPIGGQICGSKLQIAGQCAKIIEDLGFDVVDLNCGCPVDKITKDGSGSGMLKNPELIGEIIASMVAAVKIPVTVKIRVGWDLDHIVAPQVTQIAEKAGATAICIHGRTREQAYRGPANWDFIKECKEVAKNIIVIGNGDIFDAQAAKNIFAHTGSDAILVSRGTMGQPWIVEDIYRHLAGQAPIIRTGIDVRDTFIEHFEHIVSYSNERKAILDLRRVGCWFLKGGKGARELREKMNRAQALSEIRQMITDFPWDTVELVTKASQEANSEASTCAC